jgi:hypothetical protein
MMNGVQIQYDEWEAWRAIVAAYEAQISSEVSVRPVDFNDPANGPLVAAIKRWGVLYHRLRLQFPESR